MPGMRHGAFFTPKIDNLTDPCNKPTGDPAVTDWSIRMCIIHQPSIHQSLWQHRKHIKTPSITNSLGWNWPHLATPGILRWRPHTFQLRQGGVDLPGPGSGPGPRTGGGSRGSFGDGFRDHSGVPNLGNVLEMYRSCRSYEAKSFAKHASKLEWLANLGMEEPCKSLYIIVQQYKTMKRWNDGGRTASLMILRMFVCLQDFAGILHFDGSQQDYCNSHVHSKGLQILDGSSPPGIIPSKSSAIGISGAFWNQGWLLQCCCCYLNFNGLLTE